MSEQSKCRKQKTENDKESLRGSQEDMNVNRSVGRQEDLKLSEITDHDVQDRNIF